MPRSYRSSDSARSGSLSSDGGANNLNSLVASLGDGPALLLGPGSARRTMILKGMGFQPVVAVDFPPKFVVKSLMSDGKGISQASGSQQPSVDCEMPRGWFSLIEATDVLSQLPPSDGDRLLEFLRSLVCPGGIIHVEALTVAARNAKDLVDVGAPVARNTYRAADGTGVTRLFARGELAMAFEGWDLLHHSEVARSMPGDRRTVGEVAVVLARRPLGGTVLA